MRGPPTARVGESAEWSAPALWRMGILQPSGWVVEWISFPGEDLNLSPWMRKSFELAAVRDPEPDCRSAQEFFRRRESEARYTQKFGGVQGCEVEIMVQTSRRNQEVVRADGHALRGEVRFQAGMGFCLFDSKRENNMRGDERFKKSTPGLLTLPGRCAKNSL